MHQTSPFHQHHPFSTCTHAYHPTSYICGSIPFYYLRRSEYSPSGERAHIAKKKKNKSVRCQISSLTLFVNKLFSAARIGTLSSLEACLLVGVPGRQGWRWPRLNHHPLASAASVAAEAAALRIRPSSLVSTPALLPSVGTQGLVPKGLPLVSTAHLPPAALLQRHRWYRAMRRRRPAPPGS